MVGIGNRSFRRMMVMGMVYFFTILFVFGSINDSLRLFKAHELDNFAQKFDSLYGSNKNIPEKYKHIFYTALAHYPTLYTLKIDVKEDDIKSTLLVRPTALSVFKRKKNRTYQIVIDTTKFKLRGCDHLIAENARLGAMGHELGHIFDYESKTNMQVITMGIKYVLSDKYHKRTERWTDSLTTEHKLGHQLLAFNTYVNTSPYVPKKYRIMKKKYYLSTKELRKQILAINNRAKLKIVNEDDKL